MQAVSPTEVSQLTPMPRAWDNTSSGSSDRATVVAGCAAVYGYLMTQASKQAEYNELQGAAAGYPATCPPWMRRYRRPGVFGQCGTSSCNPRPGLAPPRSTPGPQLHPCGFSNPTVGRFDGPQHGYGLVSVGPVWDVPATRYLSTEGLSGDKYALSAARDLRSHPGMVRAGPEPGLR